MKSGPVHFAKNYKISGNFGPRHFEFWSLVNISDLIAFRSILKVILKFSSIQNLIFKNLNKIRKKTAGEKLPTLKLQGFSAPGP